MDVVFAHDPMRLGTGHGPADMAAIRHAALDLVKAIPAAASPEVRSKTLRRGADRLRVARS